MTKIAVLLGDFKLNQQIERRKPGYIDKWAVGLAEVHYKTAKSLRVVE